MALLDIENLTVEYPGRHGVFTAVDDVSLSVERGEILGIVGESGAGKSTIGNAIMGLLQSPGRIGQGTVSLEGERIDALDGNAMRKLRGKRIGMIFQDPMTSLNPLETIEDQLVETINHHLHIGTAQAKARAVNLLEQVGIADAKNRIKQYPHEFSGGMRQRVVIALALCAEPDLIIADEPTTALDVSIQAQILDLIKTLCREENVGMILVTHDMGVIAETADRVAVMYRGKLVELGQTHQIIRDPQHAYTKGLISAVPPSNQKIARFTRVDYADDTRAPRFEMDLNAHWLGQGPARQVEGHAMLNVIGLNKVFRSGGGFLSRAVENHAVKDVNFRINAGETYGIVGESGSGKSTIARLITGIHKPTSGEIWFNGDPLHKKAETAAELLRRRQVQMVFQDPYSSLNARMRVGDIVSEPIRVNGTAPSRRAARDIAKDLLALVELDADAAQKYPHAFSGGQRQRISIARALASRPRFLICDEPTSALDVSIQAQILNLLKDIQAKLDLTLLFISHDLPVMRQMCDRIAVMRNGVIVEEAPGEDIFTFPQHSYTRDLITLMPKFER